MWPSDTMDLGQYWLRKWLVARRHQAITWTKVEFSLLKGPFQDSDSFITYYQTWYDIQHSHMMTSSNGNIFRVTGPLCGAVTGEFPSLRPVTWSFDVFHDLRLINVRVNNREAGDLRHHRAHYDVDHCNDISIHYKCHYKYSNILPW